MPESQDREIESSAAEIENLITSSESERLKSDARMFLDQYVVGDRIVEYCTSNESWRKGMGENGYILKRNGTIVARILVRMN